MKLKLSYYLQFEGFGIADANWKHFSREKGLPIMYLSEDDYKLIGCEKPNATAPVIGVLMEREPDHYCLHVDYVKALTKAGANIVFLDYAYYDIQLAFCSGLLLPGGAFELPEMYYSDAKDDDEDYPNVRSKAYAGALKFAKAFGMPVLGICAGMQVIAAERGLKLYRSDKYFESPLHHKTNSAMAHHIDLVEETPFRKMMDDVWRLEVNSRHEEFVAPIRVQRELLDLKPDQNLPYDVYALATDGIPEAIGNMDAGILGVQWHPENLAAAGDEKQQRLFNWLVDKAFDVK